MTRALQIAHRTTLGSKARPPSAAGQIVSFKLSWGVNHVKLPPPPSHARIGVMQAADWTQT